VASFTLVVSHPPHGQVAVAEAAPHLGLAAPDFALKVNYPIPEIWAAPEHDAEARRIAAELRRAGLRVVLVPAAALAGLPQRRPVQAARLSEEGVILLAEGKRVEVSWALPVTGVYYTPRAAAPGAKEAPHRELRERGASCDGPFFELYVPLGELVDRLAVLPDVTAFSGLEHAGPLSPAGKVARFVQLCEERLTGGRVDRRLVNMQVRHWPPAGALSSGQLVRRGFSFASAGLGDLLERIGPAVVGLSHCEFASRLVYLTWRFAEAG
jgi:hypothetical protein